jgi:threonine aldolase
MLLVHKEPFAYPKWFVVLPEAWMSRADQTARTGRQLMTFIDLRSDTVTKPTDEMREAMARAEVGDDVYGEDPTVNRLQEMASAILEKESALFVPTGTMGNQLAVKLHTRPGQEVILDERSHMYNLEMAAMAVISGVLAHPLRPAGQSLDWSTIAPGIRPHSTHHAQTGLIVLENSQNLAGGTLISLQRMSEICQRAHKAGIPVHLDGARIFNAAIGLGSTATEIARPFDSVMFCISKGLGAPVGSLLVGPRDFIERAIPLRRMFGGAMRQSGVLAAAGIVALEKMISRLVEDHINARLLAEGLAGISGVEVDPEKVQTNIVVFDTSRASLDAEAVIERLRVRGVLANSIGPTQIRVVTHKDVTREDCSTAVEIVKEVLSLES